MVRGGSDCENYEILFIFKKKIDKILREEKQHHAACYKPSIILILNIV